MEQMDTKICELIDQLTVSAKAEATGLMEMSPDGSGEKLKNICDSIVALVNVLGTV